MIIHIIKDHYVHLGTIGTTLSLSGKWIYENINPLLGILAAFGGLILVVYSIIAKAKQNKILDAELKIKEEELRKIRKQ